MILGMEIALTIVALLLLIRGKSWDKNAGVGADPRFRILGGVMLTFWIVALGAGILLGVIWVVMHPNLSEAQLKEQLRWPATGIEAGVVILYAVVGHFWHRAIVRSIKARAAAAAPPA